MCTTDIIVLVFLAAATLFGIYMGVFRSLVKMLSTGISLVASMLIYPLAAAFLRKTFIFTLMKNAVIDKLGLEEMVYDATRQGERQLVESLPLPDNIIEKLAENNNSTVYSILGVDNIVDYIGGFVANIILNFVTMILVFAIVFIAVRVLIAMFGIMQNIPGVRLFSRVGGGLAGLCTGIIIVWLVFLCINSFSANEICYNIIQEINNSNIAKYLYENNIIQMTFYEKTKSW